MNLLFMRYELKISFLIVFALFFSCTIEKSGDKMEPVLSGKSIFLDRCTSCHGADGKMGFGGAKDLSTSNVSIDAIVFQVTNGKGAMAPYKNILSEEEIRSVSQYAFSLRQK